jgi:uncharacterized membrane protein (DUF2068 family)
VDWSTLACGRYGHITFAPVEPELRARLRAQLPDGEAWCCLRCGAFVPGSPDLSGPAASAPAVPRAKDVRSKLILRLFALERFLRAILFGVAAYGLWRYRYSRYSIQQVFQRELPIIRSLFRQLGFNIDHSRVVSLLQHALTLSNGSLTLLAAGAAGYAVIEVVEGTGLWLAKRWGEYFAMIATSLGLPLEIYDLARKVTVIALVAFGINLALVLYLVITKRLFGIRGGKKAYDARLRGESVLEAARRAADSEAYPAAPDAESPDSAEARGSAAARGQSPGPAARDPSAAATTAPSPGLAARDPSAAAARGRSPDPAATPGQSQTPAAARGRPPDPAAAPGQSQTPAAARGRPPDPAPDAASGPEPVKRRSLPDCGPRADDISRIFDARTRTNRHMLRTRSVKSESDRADGARFACYGPLPATAWRTPGRHGPESAVSYG